MLINLSCKDLPAKLHKIRRPNALKRQEGLSIPIASPPEVATALLRIAVPQPISKNMRLDVVPPLGVDARSSLECETQPSNKAAVASIGVAATSLFPSEGSSTRILFRPGSPSQVR